LCRRGNCQPTAKVRDLSTQLWIPRNCTVLNQSQIKPKSRWRWSCSICLSVKNDRSKANQNPI
jgi:hypothetical protein